MSLKQSIPDRLEKPGIGTRIVRDQRYRMVMSAAFGFLLNLMYAFYHGLLGVRNLSIWFSAMCAYYIILSVLRFSVVLCDRKCNSEYSVQTEYFVMKLSGILLSLLGVVLAGMVYISLSRNIAAKYNEIVMISIAAYTFYKITITIIRAVKQRKNPSPLLAVIRNIGYAEITGSVLTLQRSMIASFGTMSNAKAHTLNSWTGAAGCLFVFLLGTAITIRGTRKREGESLWQNQAS